MATHHVDCQTALLGDTGCPIGGRQSGLLTEDKKRARVCYSVPRAEQVVGDVGGSLLKDVKMHCLIAIQNAMFEYHNL